MGVFVQFIGLLHHGRSSVLALLAVLAALEMYEADLSLDRRDSLGFSRDRINTLAAGMRLAWPLHVLSCALRVGSAGSCIVESLPCCAGHVLCAGSVPLLWA